MFDYSQIVNSELMIQNQCQEFRITLSICSVREFCNAYWA